jgi:hypothetical protein
MQEVLRVAVELIDQDLDEVAGGGSVFIDGGSAQQFNISNADSNQGLQQSGIFGTGVVFADF